MLSLLDSSMKKNTSVSDLQKMGIEVEGLTDDMDQKEREKVLRTYRRKIANRESAKRSKIRKKAEDAKLLDTAKTLLADSTTMRKTIKDLQKKVDVLHAENVQLRIKLAEKGEVVDTPELLSIPPVTSVEIAPPLAPTTLVVKEAQKKKRGMLKVTSDASIATTFGDEPLLLAQSKRSKAGGNAAGPTTYGGEPDYILESFWQSHAMQRQEEQSSPFFTDNLTMYNFQDGEFVDPHHSALEDQRLF